MAIVLVPLALWTIDTLFRPNYMTLIPETGSAILSYVIFFTIIKYLPLIITIFLILIFCIGAFAGYLYEKIKNRNKV